MTDQRIAKAYGATFVFLSKPALWCHHDHPGVNPQRKATRKQFEAAMRISEMSKWTTTS